MRPCRGRAFQANTVVVSTELLAWVIFSRVRQQYPGLDLYRLLGGEGEVVPLVSRSRPGAGREALTRLHRAGRVQLASGRRPLGPRELATRRSRSSGCITPRRRWSGVPTDIEVTHPNLVHYYANRLEGYGLDAAVA